MSRRAELVPAIQRLRDVEGLMWREIGERLGIAKNTAWMYYNDPDGSLARARKAKTNGVCLDCGGPTISDGSHVPERCRSCRAAYQHEARYWTPERIIEAIRRWADEHDGEPPSATQWLNGDRPDWAPTVFTVQYEFGTWNRGIEAAGFESVTRGRRRTDRTRDDYIAAIQRWAREHGAPPTQRGWARAADGYPSSTGVAYVFGSWNAAVAAAGFEPRGRGRPRVAALSSTERPSRASEAPAGAAASAPGDAS